CYECHGEKKQQAGLRLDQPQAMLKGGDSGPCLVSGKSADSLLIQVVAGLREDIARMPKKRPPLSSEEIGLMRAWIDQGARIESGVAKAQGGSPAAATGHWAFKVPARPPVPSVEHAAWVRNPIDRFIHAHLEKEGLAPSPEADRVTLLRRLSLDLIG